MFEVESDSFELNLNKSLWVEISNVETWWFTGVGSSRSKNEVETDWFLLDHVSDNLILLLMNMSINTKSDDGLESVHKSMVSSSVLSVALVNVWNMRKHNGLSANFL